MEWTLWGSLGNSHSRAELLDLSPDFASSFSSLLRQILGNNKVSSTNHVRDSEFMAPGFNPGLAMAVAGIWGVKWQMGDLSICLCLCPSAFQIHKLIH